MDQQTMLQNIQEAKAYLRKKGVLSPHIGLILGSGLGELANEITEGIVIPYHDIPHFPVSGVEGHAGQLVYGKLAGRSVLAMQGRVHYYEGFSMSEVTFPIRVMAAVGIETIVLTNAAGGVNKSFKPGDLMLINDHINYMGDHPLIGFNDASFGTVFPDVTNAYDKNLRGKIQMIAKQQQIDLKEGVYMSFSGPTFETPAEIRMATLLGADAVGMSTVPETLVASQLKLKVVGISCITNMAAGLQANVNHEEVIETTIRVKETFKNLVKNIITIL